MLESLTVDQFTKFLAEVNSLRNLLICPICEKIARNPVNTVCNHIFCSNCLESLVNMYNDQKPTVTAKCPACSEPIDIIRNSQTQYIVTLMDFLDDISSIPSFDWNELSDEDKIKTFYEENITTSNISTSSVIATSNKEGDFDRLLRSYLNELHPNFSYKNKVSKTYTSLNKSNLRNKVDTFESQVTIFDKPKPFMDENVKFKIQKWLADSAEMFPQLQESENAVVLSGESNESLNMPSVSQLTDKITPNINTTLKRRHRSCENLLKVPVVILKRHTLSPKIQNKLKTEATMEAASKNKDVDAVVKKSLEDEFLDSINLEMGTENTVMQPRASGNVKKGNRRNKKKRPGKVKKATRSSKVMKKLDVTIISPKDKENIKTNVGNNETKFVISKPKNPVVLVEKLEANQENYYVNTKPLNTCLKNINSSETSPICNITPKDDNVKTSTFKKKLFDNSYMSEETCSKQCSKKSCNKNCEHSTSKSSKTNSLDKVIYDVESEMNKVLVRLKTESHSITSHSTEKLKTIVNKLNELLDLNKLKQFNTTSTQTELCDKKDISVQTVIKKFQPKHTQTKDLHDSNCHVSVQTTHLITRITTVQTEIENNDKKFNSVDVQTDEQPNLEFESNSKSPQNDPNIDLIRNEIEQNPQENTSKKSSKLNSQLLFSVSNSKINSKEECEQQIAHVLKRFKRIRSVESQSDEDSFLKKRRIENKYLKDDVSIEMISENIFNQTTSLKSTSSSKFSLKNCEEVDYDSFLNNIMKKYENKSNQPSTSKATESQTVFERCDAMIKAITMNNPNKEKNNNTSFEKKRFQNEVRENIENMVVKDLPIDEKMIQEFDEAFEQKTTQNCQSAGVPCTESIMANIDVEEIERSIAEKSKDLNATVQSVSKTNAKPNEDEDQSFEEDDKVVILHNITIERPKRHGDSPNVETDESQDLFNSEPDKLDDVVDTTPTKQSQIIDRPTSQLQRKSVVKNSLKLPPPIDSPDVIALTDPISFLDQKFTPPTDFRDQVKTVASAEPANSRDLNLMTLQTSSSNKKNHIRSNESIINLITSEDFAGTLIPSDDIGNQNNTVQGDVYKSLTETQLMNLINEAKSEEFVTSTQISNSMKRKFEAPGISPICAEKKKSKNVIEIARSSKFAPLEIIPMQKTQTQRSKLSLTAKQKSILSFVKPDKLDIKNDSQISIDSNFSPTAPIKPHVSCTRLSKEQMLLVSRLAQTKLINYTTMFSPEVTHVIVATNSQNCLQDHTMKVLMAIVHRKWVLRIDWVKECLNQNKIVPEETYEALDMTGLPGPQISRLNKMKKPLLKDIKIYLEPPFLSTTKEDIEHLITILGGEIIPEIRLFKKIKGIKIVLAEAKTTQDFDMCEKYLQDYNVISVDIEWLSRTIGQYQLVSLKPFMLCTDDNLVSLGYPPEMTLDVSFSCSQSACPT